MKLIALLLFIMIVLTLINGIVFMKKLVKLQKENNNLLREIANNKKSFDLYWNKPNILK